MTAKPARLARNIIYENPWVNLYVDKVEFPGGKIVDKHHFLDFDMDAVAIIIENERQDILFIRAYRYTTDTIEWEIPAGGVDQGETILEAAQREVYEETGYEISGLDLRYAYHPMIGISNKVFHIAYARAKGQTGDFDRNEVQIVTWFTRREVQSMIRNRTIKDGLTLTALLLHLNTTT